MTLCQLIFIGNAKKHEAQVQLKKNGMQICGECIEYLFMHMVLGRHRSMPLYLGMG
jgi:hypothetical protein